MLRVRSSTLAVLTFAFSALACSNGEKSIGAAVVDSGADGTTSDAEPDTGADAPVDTAPEPDTAPDADADADADDDAGADDAGADGEVDTGVDAGPSCAVTPIGRPCTDTQPCPDPFICYGFGATGFCATPEPQCGGFIDKKCTGGRLCLRASGSSLGYCATAEELPCICKAEDAGAIDGCSP